MWKHYSWSLPHTSVITVRIINYEQIIYQLREARLIIVLKDAASKTSQMPGNRSISAVSFILEHFIELYTSLSVYIRACQCIYTG